MSQFTLNKFLEISFAFFSMFVYSIYYIQNIIINNIDFLLLAQRYVLVVATRRIDKQLDT